MKVFEIFKVIDKIIHLASEELKNKFIHAISYLICMILFLTVCYFCIQGIDTKNFLLMCLCFIVLLVFGFGCLIIGVYELVIFISALFCIKKNSKLAIFTLLFSLIAIASLIPGIYLLLKAGNKI